MKSLPRAHNASHVIGTMSVGGADGDAVVEDTHHSLIMKSGEGDPEVNADTAKVVLRLREPLGCDTIDMLNHGEASTCCWQCRCCC